MFLSQNIWRKIFLAIFILVIFSPLSRAHQVREYEEPVLPHHYYLIELQNKVEHTDLSLFSKKFEVPGINIVESSDSVLIIKNTEDEVRYFITKYFRLINHVYILPLHDEMKLIHYPQHTRTVVLKWNHKAKIIENKISQAQEKRRYDLKSGALCESEKNEIDLQNEYKNISNLLRSLKKEHLSISESLKITSGEISENRLLEKQKEVLERRISSLNKKLVGIQDRLNKLRHIKGTSRTVPAKTGNVHGSGDILIPPPREAENKLEIFLNSLKKIKIQTGTGKITGTVTNSSGQGILYVAVYVYDLDYNYVSSVWTDASGNYEITNLSTGTYRLQFYVYTSYTGNYLSEWYNDKSNFSTADDVLVTDGSTTSGIDAVLAAGGIISGTVTEAPATGIHTANGSGIENVFASVYDLDGTYIDGVSTDSSGNYQIMGLPTGTYRVGFNGLDAGNYLSEWYNDKLCFSVADDVLVTAGSTTTGIDAALATGGIISGIVTDVTATGIHLANGSGIEDVYVYAYDQYDSYINGAWTDSSGNYQIEGLPTGTYRVEFYGLEAGNYITEYYNDKSSYSTADGVLVTAGSTTTGIDAALAAGGIISGIVTEVTATSTHLANGSGVENVWVGAYDQEDSLVNSGYTDSSGNYEITGLPTGTYKVEFDALAAGNYVDEWYNDKSNSSTADDVLVTAGSTTTGIDAALAAGGIISGTVAAASVPGMHPANGSGIENAYVWAYDKDVSTWYFASTDSSGNYEISGLPTGTYRVWFYGLDVGNYISEWYNDKSSLSLGDDVLVTAGSTTTGIDATLAEGGIISGTVTDASVPGIHPANSSGIQNVFVYIYDLNYDLINWGTTCPAGKYQIQGFPTGTYRVWFYGLNAGGYISEWFNDESSFSTANNGQSSFYTADNVAITAGSTTSGIDAVLTEGGNISGYVTDTSVPGIHLANNSGIENILVSICDQNGNYITDDWTECEGNYTVRGIPPGNHIVFFDAWYVSSIYGNYASEFYIDTFEFSEASLVSVSQGQTTSGVNAQLGIGGQISGTVNNSSSGISSQSSGLSGVSIAAWDPTFFFFSITASGPDGKYSLRGLPTADYCVEFNKSGYPTKFYNNRLSWEIADPVSVVAGTTVTSIDATMEKSTATISGRVTDNSGRGIYNVQVVFFDENQNLLPANAWTNILGEYTATVPPGTWRIRFGGGFTDGAGATAGISAGGSTDDSYASEFYNNRSKFSQADAVSVAAGAVIDGIDAVLVPGGGIQGRVTRQTGGAGINNAENNGIDQVMAMLKDEDDNLVSSWSTEDGGYYRMRGVAEGTYKIYFDPPEHLKESVSGIWYNNKNSFSAADTISVTAGVVTPDINASLPPKTGLQLSKKILNFGSTTSGLTTNTQHFSISASELDNLNWFLSIDENWLTCSPAFGTGAGKIAVSVDPSGLSPGTYTASILVFNAVGASSPQIVTINLTVYDPKEESAPFGNFNTPLDKTSGVSGAIPLAGWVLDDIGATKVEIKRDPSEGDSEGAIDNDGLVYIGDAVFVKGARPDVEQSYPIYPLNDRAGWGYMMQTHSLSNRGNGTFSIYAFAYDASGNRAEIGKKTITCDNANRTNPFGTIDAPKQGEVVSGNLYMNVGWALTPPPAAITRDGSTIRIYIDGLSVGHPTYNQYREDIAHSFLECLNSDGAVGYFYIDTTKYENGMHNINWHVVDNTGEADRVDSRFFVIENLNSPRTDESVTKSINYREDASGSMKIGVDGEREIEIEELERIELKLRGEGGSEFIGWRENRLNGLPIGSTLDKEKGIFYWMPGPGFFGRHVLHFAVTDGQCMSKPVEVVVNIIPKKYER